MTRLITRHAQCSPQSQDALATRSDIGRLVRAVHNIATEVWNMTQHVVQAVTAPNATRSRLSRRLHHEEGEDADDESDDADILYRTPRRKNGLTKHLAPERVQLAVGVSRHRVIDSVLIIRHRET